MRTITHTRTNREELAVWCKDVAWNVSPCPCVSTHSQNILAPPGSFWQGETPFLILLIVIRLDLKVALWVSADWAAFWRLLADNDVATVAAYPHAVALFREHHCILDVLE